MSLYDLDDTPLPNLPSAEKTCRSWIMAAVPKPKPLHFSVARESFWGFPMWNSAENVFARSGSFREGGDNEEALRWTALEQLPTYARV
ncbi:hypothetical protein ACFX11_009881 [Malus domestica]